MRLVKSAMILALAAFWALAVNHCRLEAVAEFDFLACSPSAEETHDHEPKDCESDGCEVIENGFYKASKTYISVGQPVLGSGLFVLDSLCPPVPGTLLKLTSPTDPIPIALAVTWHFLSRAAPSPRAPASAC